MSVVRFISQVLMNIVCTDWFVAHRFCSAPAIFQDYKGFFFKLDNLNPCGDSKLKNDREMKLPPLIHPLLMQRDLMICDYLI